MRDRLLVAAILRPSSGSDLEALERADALVETELQNSEKQVAERKKKRESEAKK